MRSKYVALEWLLFVLASALPPGALAATVPGNEKPIVAPPHPPQDARFKADLLLIVAHPDDETLVSTYLARVVHDQDKKVAVVFTTRGEGGANKVGTEQGFAIGAVREQESRRALGELGITNAWFLGGINRPTGNVLESLDSWGHGRLLEDVVRLVRLVRPEVVLTWVPTHVIGQNHSDHQAAGVLGTEAYDLAGDPAAFPAQVADAGNRKRALTTEGLRPWRPQKLYYFSDMRRQELLKGKGPLYACADVSKTLGTPYFQVAVRSEAHYLTQDSYGLVALRALQNGNTLSDYRDRWRPYRNTEDVQLILGRSEVGGKIAGDVFENVKPGAARPFVPVRRRGPASSPGFSVALGGPWSFYREFWAAHDIEHIARVTPPAAGVRAGSALLIPLILENGTGSAAEVTLSAALPPGWSESPRPGRFLVPAGGRYPVVTEILAPNETVAAKPAGGEGARSLYPEIVWKAEIAGRPAFTTSLLVDRE